MIPVKKIVLSLCLILCGVSILSGCTKDEVLDQYNNIVQSAGSIALTGNSSLQGTKEKGIDDYTGCYTADYEDFSDTEYLFGGTSIKREAGKDLSIDCALEVTEGTAKVFWISGSDEAVTLLETTGTYSDTITLPEGGNYTYIIFITANDKESDMLKGYEVGGADYVTKPFSVTVLCKKVAAVFANLELRTPRHDLFDDGFLKIDFSEQSASLAGESLDFTPKEYRTLFLFVKNPRIILTKRQILEKLWDIDGDFVDEHTLTTIISRIRKKIETDERKYIKTAYGMGYQWIGGEPR